MKRRTTPCPCCWRLLFRTCLLVGAAGCGDGPSGDATPTASAGGSNSSSAGGDTTSLSGTDGAIGTTTTGSGGSSSNETSAGGGQTTASSASGGSATGAGAMGGAVGTGGSATTGGGAGSGGELGTGTPEICSFELEATTSSAIQTVGVVDWSTDLENLSAARIEFTLNDPSDDEFNRGSSGPIDITGETHRALMLGLKPERSYSYRIVAESGDTVCISPERRLSTGPLPDAPAITRTRQEGATPSEGFIVTTSWGGAAFIIDVDGEVVWWMEGPSETTRARMDWAAEYMWVLDGNPAQGAVGEMRRISLDGADVLENVEGLEDAHHDFTVLPGGVVAALVWSGEDGSPSDVVERSPDGSLTTVARLDENYLRPTSDYHANSIMYHASDDSYTVGDLSVASYVKLTRDGELLWQFSNDCEDALAPKCATGDLVGNHGHHLLEDGTFLFFRASTATNIAYEYELTEAANLLTANEVWSYTSGFLNSLVLGDIQRLPNGNTLVIISAESEIHEVTSSGEVVQAFTMGAWFGYATFRETLYGPPLR